MSVHIFGIRHHGPGSARSLVQALQALQPDCVLIEGPPDADTLLPLFAHADMRPPVALLIYAADHPKLAGYYPFAVFSPELQAARYAAEAGITVRFMDLPQTHQFAIQHLEFQRLEQQEQEQREQQEQEQREDEPTEQPPESAEAALPAAQRDPLGYLAEAAGYSDGERWWEQMIEQRRDSLNVFEAILEAMTAVREHAPPETSPTEILREAWMRQSIRLAEKQGHKRVAVVCGAWHGPALVDRSQQKADAALLKGLPKMKVQATFSPWTYGRLAASSGYGAGILSPGYYDHLWNHPEDVTVRWMSRVAHLLRDQDLDASAANVIEAVRLAETLAALRERPLPGLPELNEAAQAVFCFGSDMPMRLIHDKLVVGQELGAVPAETPAVPLQADLQREQRRLRMQPEAGWHDYDLDLRKQNDLERSHLLHRLNLLGIEWGTLQRTHGARGTFHEQWRLEWQPEYTVDVIEASMWGTSVAEAAAACLRSTATRTDDLPRLTKLLDQALLADIPDAVAALMRQLESVAAVASDIDHLMGALPALANVLRYGNVRRTDTSAVGHIVDGLVARICIGLPGACASLDDTAAARMFEHIEATQRALALIHTPALDAQWQAALAQVAGQQGVHGLVAGRCCRLLLDSGAITGDELAQRLGFALSPAAGPQAAAAWIEGALKGSGTLLIHHTALWNAVDTWVSNLPAEPFAEVLPLLRRTFATFSQPERRQIGERARHGANGGPEAAEEGATLDTAQAEAALPIIAQLLGFAYGGTDA